MIFRSLFVSAFAAAFVGIVAVQRLHTNRFGLPQHFPEWRNVDVPSKNCVHGSRGNEVCVVLGDMMKLNVDACVNAANGNLAHGGGIARAFVVHGGDVVQTESDQHVQQYGTLPTSHTAVTGGGRLQCPHIIHVVGPVFRNGRSGEDEELRQVRPAATSRR